MSNQKHDDIRDIRNRQVVRSNELILQSRYTFTAQQQKIILFLISCISPFDDDFNEIEFDISTFCKVCGLDATNGQYYADLKADIKSIADKSIWITLPNGQETLLRWIEKPYIDKGNGRVKIRLDHDMKPYLLQLRENFTQTQLIYSLHFKSKYALRLYDFICAIHFHPLEQYQSRQFTIPEIRKYLNVPDDIYPQYRDLKRFAIAPAIKEINAYSDKQLDVQEIKQGRKTVAIQFVIGTKKLEDRLQTVVQIERDLDGQKCLFDAEDGDATNG